MNLFIDTPCIGCKHYIGTPYAPTCKAFPKGIPEQIATGENDHTKPFKGDNGIQFEPINKERYVRDKREF